MVDAIVSTGANIVDQDFFEALGYRHYIAGRSEYKYGTEDATLRELMIDRIYDTFIDEKSFAICDDTTGEDHRLARAATLQLARVYRGCHGRLPRKPTAAPREKGEASTPSFSRPTRRHVPIFCPAFSDCSAGFGLVAHQHAGKASRWSRSIPPRTSTSSPS